MQLFAALLNVSSLGIIEAFCILLESKNAAFCSYAFLLETFERRMPLG